MMRMAAIPLILIAATAGAAPRGPRVPPATPVGKPIDCVRLADIRETRVRDDRTIDFYLRGRGDPVLRNTLPNSCSELGFERAFSYRTSLDRLCSVDIITVFRQGGDRGSGVSCGLGKFQPVTGVPR